MPLGLSPGGNIADAMHALLKHQPSPLHSLGECRGRSRADLKCLIYSLNGLGVPIGPLPFLGSHPCRAPRQQPLYYNMRIRGRPPQQLDNLRHPAGASAWPDCLSLRWSWAATPVALQPLTGSVCRGVNFTCVKAQAALILAQLLCAAHWYHSGFHNKQIWVLTCTCKRFQAQLPAARSHSCCSLQQ